MVYVLLGKGFEETEALVPMDILRRAGVEAFFAAVGNDTAVAGGTGIRLIADLLVKDITPAQTDVFVIPGGMEGVNSIKSDSTTMELLDSANKVGSTMAAICAGPSVLAELHITDGKNITCYPGCENMMGSAVCNTENPTMLDSSLITGRAPGSAIDFGLKLLEYLKGTEIMNEVKMRLVY